MKEKVYGFIFLLFAVLSLALGVKIVLQKGIPSNKLSQISKKEKIGIVKIYGPIYVPSQPISILRAKGSDRIVEEIENLLNEKNLKAIILRFNSPGGSVGAVQEIYQEIEKAKQKGIKVIASFGDVAASGAYYLASNCDWIVSNPGTITGSIGVLMGFTSLEGIFKKLGIEMEIIKSGKYKDIGNMSRKMTQDEKQLIKGLVLDVYDQFVEAVSKGRKMPKEKVKELAQGQIFTGKKALSLGLVDELGNLGTAIKSAEKIAGIKGKAKIVYPKSYGFSDIMSVLNSIEEKYEYIKRIF